MNIIIRSMLQTDPEKIAAAEREQGWDARADIYEMRLTDEREGRCRTFVAEMDGQPVGYVNLYFRAKEGPFKNSSLPIIVDFGVLEKYRRQGIGTALMDAAEKAAKEIASAVCLGVGLYDGYGSAQRMYVKRGYIPDGSGVWYQDKPLPPYEPCLNDDDLVLYFSKEL